MFLADCFNIVIFLRMMFIVLIASYVDQVSTCLISVLFCAILGAVSGSLFNLFSNFTTWKCFCFDVSIDWSIWKPIHLITSLYCLLKIWNNIFYYLVTFDFILEVPCSLLCSVLASHQYCDLQLLFCPEWWFEQNGEQYLEQFIWFRCMFCTYFVSTICWILLIILLHQHVDQFITCGFTYCLNKIWIFMFHSDLTADLILVCQYLLWCSSYCSHQYWDQYFNFCSKWWLKQNDDHHSDQFI